MGNIIKHLLNKIVSYQLELTQHAAPGGVSRVSRLAGADGLVVVGVADGVDAARPEEGARVLAPLVDAVLVVGARVVGAARVHAAVQLAYVARPAVVVRVAVVGGHWGWEDGDK